jgi:hypothetical protein
MFLESDSNIPISRGVSPARVCSSGLYAGCHIVLSKLYISTRFFQNSLLDTNSSTASFK